MAQQKMVKDNDLDALLDYYDVDNDFLELMDMTDDSLISRMESHME